jgi:hypothetical protein
MKTKAIIGDSQSIILFGYAAGYNKVIELAKDYISPIALTNVPF